jgi:beta-lactamase class A
MPENRLVLAMVMVAASACGRPPPPAAPTAPPTPPALPAAPKAEVPKAEAPKAEVKVPTPEEAVARLFNGKPEEAWFTERFLDAAPIGKIAAITERMKQNLGAFREVKKAGASYTTVFAKGEVPTEITLDPQGRFSGLFFRPAVIYDAKIEDAVAALRALPGKVSLLVTTDGKERVALEADAPLAVGSAFKLAVLSALVEQIDAKKRAWKDVVELKKEWKSLPSGVLQNWPEASPITIGTLASMMISQSDNTATDALIHLVGRAAIERLSPKTRPFFTTREAFVLKDPVSEAWLLRFRDGDEAARRKVLGELPARPLPTAATFTAEPRALDIEWRFSARELCALMDKVGHLPLMTINPGVATASEWERVAYKGGSEPGVLNLTTLVTAKGRRHCVVATWNDDKALDESKLFNLYGQLFSALKKDGG